VVPCESSRRSLALSRPHDLDLWLGKRSDHGLFFAMRAVHTRISNSDLDAATLKRHAIQCEGFFQAFNGSEFSVTKAFGSLQLAILDESDAGDLAALQKLVDILDCYVVIEIPQVGEVGWLVGDALGTSISLRVSYYTDMSCWPAVGRGDSRRSPPYEPIPRGRRSVAGSGCVP